MLETRQELMVYLIVITSTMVFIAGVMNIYNRSTETRYDREFHIIKDAVAPGNVFDAMINDSDFLPAHYGLNDKINNLYWSISIHDIYGNNTWIWKQDITGMPEIYSTPILINEYNYTGPGDISINLWK